MDGPEGRRYGQKFPADYIEVRYEDLVCNPEKTLSTLGEFLDHDLDYGRIQKTAVGRVASPNTVWKVVPTGDGTEVSAPDSSFQTVLGEATRPTAVF